MGTQVLDTWCRVCKQSQETLTYICVSNVYILSARPTDANSSHIHRHHAALRVLYYYLRNSYGIDKTPVLPYNPGDVESVVANWSCKIYWNSAFSTVRAISATRPDIVLFDLAEKIIYVIKFSVPGQNIIFAKEEEKQLNYQPLLCELRQLNQGFRLQLIVLIIGNVDGIKQSFICALENIPACGPKAHVLTALMQKAGILGSLWILRGHESGL